MNISELQFQIIISRLAVCQTDSGAACGGGDEAVRGGGAGGEPGGVAGRTHDAQEDHRARRKQGQGLQVQHL